MQVARKPNRRPYGLILVCLVVLCLAVPRYWQARNATRLQPAAERPTDAAALVWYDLGDDPYVVDFSTFGEPLSPSDRRSPVLDGDLFAELIAPPCVPVATPPLEPFWADIQTLTARWAADWLDDARLQLLQVSPDRVMKWMARLAEAHHEATSAKSPGQRQPEELLALQLIDPMARRSTTPRKTVRLPSFNELVDGEAADAPQSADWPWTAPASLIRQIELLSEFPATADWAGETLATLRSLTDDQPTPGSAERLIERLDWLADEAVRLTNSTRDEQLRVELLRAHWGLARRVDCWSKMCAIKSRQPERERVASRGSLHGLLAGSPGATAPTADLEALSVGLEAYERTGRPSIGRAVRAQQVKLLASSDDTERQLGETVEKHYRNANLRIAVTGELLNRYLTQDRTTAESVCDCIVGTPVRGQSETVSRSRVHLQPATGLWKLELETEGTVHSNTLADGGPAVVHTLSATDYWVREPIIIDRESIHTLPASSDAENCAKVVGVKTMYDWVPLLGSYVRAKAMEEYRTKRPRAKAEVECKVASRASHRVGSEAQRAADRVKQEVRERFTVPLTNYGIEVTPIELTTTDQRLIARLRMASDGQLGANSPRPRAPADSLASAQVHQSALTNAAIALDLNGKRLTAPELQQQLRSTFPRMAQERPEREVHEDTVFDFADRDAIQFRVSEGRAELLIALKEFVYEGRTSRRFIVHAFYRPVVDGLDAKLVRDGSLGIEGRLSAGERARLHNVFETVLAEDRAIPVFRVEDPNDQRLAGLMVTQLVLEDGWVGLAIGPESDGRVAQRWRSLR